MEKDLCLRTLNLSLTETTSSLEENGTFSKLENTLDKKKRFDENIDSSTTELSKKFSIMNDESLTDDDFAEDTETTEIHISSTQLLEIIGASADHSEVKDSVENDEPVEKASTNESIEDDDQIQNDINLQINQTSSEEELTAGSDNELSVENHFTNASEENEIEKHDKSLKHGDSIENDISLQINQTSSEEELSASSDNEDTIENDFTNAAEENEIEKNDKSLNPGDPSDNDISLQNDQISPKEVSTSTLDSELSTVIVLKNLSEENGDKDDAPSISSDLIGNNISLQISSTEESANEIINNDHSSKKNTEKEISPFSIDMSETSLIENEQPMISLTVDNLIKNMDL